MKIWIDTTIPAPEGYRWCKTGREVIDTMQNASLASDYAIRHGYEEFFHKVFGHTSTTALCLEELNMSDEFANSGDYRMLMMYMEELGKRKTLCMKTH